VRTGRASRHALAMRRYREDSPDYADRERKRKTARWEAFQALARKYPAEYMRLYEAELEYAGLEPPMSRPCPCGGVIRRRAPSGRWPSSCGECRKQAAAGETRSDAADAA
jgi:hypothetical protein